MAGRGEKVLDFIAGMTDRYVVGAFRAVVLPERVMGTYRKGWRAVIVTPNAQ